jgi:tetratricopeptide (TPR) repeat protein
MRARQRAIAGGGRQAPGICQDLRPSAPAALFAIGSVLAEDHEDDKAIGILESLLVAYGASPWVPAANDQLGQLYARTGKPDQAIKALQSCISTSTDPELVRTARFQLGYVLLKQTRDYAGAAAQFAQISDGADPSAENAATIFSWPRPTWARTIFSRKAEADFEKRFPKSSYLKAIALAEGQLLAGAGKTDDAKAVYQKPSPRGERPRPGSAAQSPGRSPIPDQRPRRDARHLQDDRRPVPQRCAGRGAARRPRFLRTEETQRGPGRAGPRPAGAEIQNVPGAPEAYFRLGEFYFYRQDYVRAQDAFQQLTANYPNSDDADKAYFYAGRAAFAHQDYAAARTLLEKVPDSSPFKPDARLWEGRVYQQQLNFDQADTFYDAVLATEKTGPRFVEASLLKGQCLFELGARTRPTTAGAGGLRPNPQEQGRDDRRSQRSGVAAPNAWKKWAAPTTRWRFISTSSTGAWPETMPARPPARVFLADQGRLGSRAHSRIPEGLARGDRDLQAARADRRRACAGLSRPDQQAAPR